jgi:hypothetical protein
MGKQSSKIAETIKAIAIVFLGFLFGFALIFYLLYTNNIFLGLVILFVIFIATVIKIFIDYSKKKH